MNDLFGSSVTVSGDGTTVAVSAEDSCVGCGFGDGYVRVFKLPNLTQIGQKLVGNDGAWFGHSIKLSRDGKILVVGEYPDCDLLSSQVVVCLLTSV